MGDRLLPKEDFLPEVGDLIVTKIHFGKKDGNLTLWVQSIPRGRFSITIKDALRAYLNGDTSFKLPVYPPVKNPKDTVLKSLSIGKGDYDIYTYLFSIEKYMRANHIKAILNHFLNGTPKPVVLSKPQMQPLPTNVPLSEKDNQQVIKESQIKDINDRAKRNKLRLIQLSKMMDSEAYGQE